MNADYTGERSVESILARFDGAHKNGSGWMARCPAHDDQTASLAISTGDNGGVVLFCHAGCETETILETIGLEMKDLFPPAQSLTREIADTYDYTDEHGTLLYQTVRYSPKGFSQRRPDGMGDWIWNLRGVKSVLYNLRALASASPNTLVFVVEGERDVETLRTLGLLATTNPSGARKWRASYNEWLRGQRVAILSDNDPAGKEHGRTVHQNLLDVAASVAVVDLPGLPPKGDVSDWIADGGTRAGLVALVEKALATPAPAAAGSPGLKLVDPSSRMFVIRGESIDLADSALSVLSSLQLMAADPVYVRGRELVRMVCDAKPPRGVKRPSGGPSIEMVSAPVLRDTLARLRPWKTATGSERACELKDAMPPMWLVENIMSRASWPLRALERVSETPTMRPDGSIVAEAGYDDETGVVLAPTAAYPTVPNRPTRDDAIAAADVLKDVLQDFPFREVSDEAAALAMILSLVARDAIDGPCPLFFLRSPAPGTGKGLLTDVATLIGTGRPCARMGISDRDDEMRKSILSIALAGLPAVMLDNMTGRFGSRSLAAALTSRTWTDRYLGESRNVTAPLTAVWIGTGNNVTFRGDLGRRVVPIDLDAEFEHPEDRQNFAYPDLLDRVHAIRPALVVAALTVLRAYHVAGRPRHELPRKGSFEAWDDLIRGCLMWCGIGDPDGAKERIRDDSDNDLVSLGAVLDAAAATFKAGGFTAKGLLAAGESVAGESPDDKVLCEALRDALAEWATDSKGRLTPTTIGHALRDGQGRIVHGKRFVAVDDGHGGRIARTWKVETLHGGMGG